jgi:DNA polymerase/3'-5' exonuclease PolX
MGEKHEAKAAQGDRRLSPHRRTIPARHRRRTGRETGGASAGGFIGRSGIEKVTPAGSLRRGRETVGDLDILVTGKGCIDAGPRQKIIEHLLRFPGLMDVIAQGENKVSFRHRNGMQVDVRLLPPESFGAAMQYFTGLEGAQCGLAPARAQDGLHAERIQPVATVEETGAGRAQDGRRNLRQAEARLSFLPNCARIWERSKPPPDTRCRC